MTVLKQQAQNEHCSHSITCYEFATAPQTGKKETLILQKQKPTQKSLKCHTQNEHNVIPPHSQHPTTQRPPEEQHHTPFVTFFYTT